MTAPERQRRTREEAGSRDTENTSFFVFEVPVTSPGIIYEPSTWNTECLAACAG